MAAPFEPSLTASMLRPPLASADAPSMADQLPNVQFGFENLRAEMSQFTAKFDGFLERGRKQVLEERNRFRVDLAELREGQRMRRRDIEILNMKSQTHAQTLDKEAAEAEEMRAAIMQVETQRDVNQQTRDKLRQQIEETQRAISERLEAQQAHARRLEAQARLNEPELEFWQDVLCLHIESAGKEDHVKIVFTHLVDRDWDSEAWFELSTEGGEYGVVQCRPKLPRSAIDKEVEKVNEERDFGAFLKRMRRLFVRAMK
ncbi:kinetochore-associated Ndc80 complex subunit spc25 [Ascosphaera atra]|nr:kinetochore-associated Ndc80 complex subunit spc25 [Ascosphaera atra]